MERSIKQRGSGGSLNRRNGRVPPTAGLTPLLAGLLVRIRPPELSPTLAAGGILDPAGASCKGICCRAHCAGIIWTVMSSM